MPRDGTANLIPNTRLTEEERRQLASRAGKASVESRRRKRDAKKAMLLILESMPKIDARTAAIVEELGIKKGSKGGKFTIEDIENIALAQKAMKGDVKARKLQLEIIGEDASSVFAAQRMEIERLRFELEKAKAQGEAVVDRPDDGFISALQVSAQGVWSEDESGQLQDTPRNLHDTPGAYGDEWDGNIDTSDGGTDPELDGD